MPSVNRTTLQYMVGHLQRVSAQSDLNKMKPSALAIVFGPTLLRTGNTDPLVSLADMPLQVTVVELLTKHADVLFPPASLLPVGFSDPLDC
jgi:hypothetical protein